MRDLRARSARGSERLGAITGLIATIAVGAPVLLDAVVGDGELIDAPPALWWAAYLAFVAAFAVDAVSDRRAEPARRRLLLAVEVAAAAATYLADPGYGWAIVLFVVTAASGAYSLPPMASAVQVVGQVLVIGAGQVGRVPVGEVALTMVVYGSFQAFAVLVVGAERREAEAHALLAAANVDLRATSALLAETTQATERLRIARELHDVIGHQLTALSLELEVASHHVNGDGTGGEAKLHVDRARNIARDLLGDVRDAVGELRTPGSQLGATLEQLVRDLPGPTVSLAVVEKTPVDDERAVVIVRCVQEIVTNTLRHADADNLWISVHSDSHGATVSAGDDGRGADPVRPGIGLTGMRERVEDRGGDLLIESAPGRGFRVTARIPPP